MAVSAENWSRRESIDSIQDRETDYVRDTSDTSVSENEAVEYEPVSELEDGDGPVTAESESENDIIISTKVIEVSVGDEGDLEFADSEQTDSDGSDSENDLYDYGQCAQCRGDNENPLYRYCVKCFKVRKNFFPPRPKRKYKRKTVDAEHVPTAIDKEHVPLVPATHVPTVDVQRTCSQDSGVELSQDLLRSSQPDTDLTYPNGSEGTSSTRNESDINVILGRPPKRRAESADRKNKRMRVDYSDSESGCESKSPVDVTPLVKTVSDPSLTIDDSADSVKLTKKAIANSIREKIVAKDDLCIMCYTEPKSGVFVHGRLAHICACYKCAMKVWVKAKRCPICNCRVSNVLKAVIL